MKSPENKIVEERISHFEDVKEQITPAVLEALMNGYNNEQFWAEEYLEDSFERDIAFGAKIWGGFAEILETAQIVSSEVPEDLTLVGEFNFLSELAMRADLPIDSKLRATAVLKIKEAFVKRGFKNETLSGSNIMKLAYIGEAEIMELCGIDWRGSKPFSFSLGLNLEHREVKKALADARQEGHLADLAIKSDSDLEKIFSEFYEGKEPTKQ
ncbi:MAG: hypothetical protein Q7S12_00965 [bacterium]|nr:hypothetical protein [bacterium]